MEYEGKYNFDSPFKYKINIEYHNKVCYFYDIQDKIHTLTIDFKRWAVFLRIPDNSEVTKVIWEIKFPNIAIGFDTLIRLFDVNEYHVYEVLNINLFGYAKLTNEMIELNKLMMIYRI